MEVIKIDNVHKSFKIYYDKGSTLKEKILFKNRNKHEVHNVLKGVSLSVEKGEVIGLVGENGSGKSTLLKLMTKIIYPDKGSIEIKGKISSLLELGAGFHPDMTGRENIYINASIFGLTKKEIDDRLERIIDFSELREFIDNPVRTYSSGMYMRLAFSVAINVDAEVLLVDEILAVGDASFQAKCFNKMQEIKNDGTTIVIVSHDLNSIEKLCDKAVWIDGGHKKLEASPHDVIAEYLDKIMNKNSEFKQNELELGEAIENKESENKFENRTGNKEIEIKSVKMVELNSNEEKHKFKPEDSVKIVIEYVRHKDELLESVIGFGIMRKDGFNCYGTNTYIDNRSKIKVDKRGTIEIFLEKIQLLEGEYTLDIAFHDEYGKPYDYIRKIKDFSIYSNINDVGIVRLNHEFRVK